MTLSENELHYDMIIIAICGGTVTPQGTALPLLFLMNQYFLEEDNMFMKLIFDNFLDDNTALVKLNVIMNSVMNLNINK